MKDLQKFTLSLLVLVSLVGIMTVPIRADELSVLESRSATNLVLEEGREYSLEEIADQLDLPKVDRDVFIRRVLSETKDLIFYQNSNSPFRRWQTTVLQRLSHREVQKVENSSNPIATLLGMFSKTISVIGYLEDLTFKTAARNGWGLEWVISVDTNNPTSTGMKFFWRYVR